MKTLAKFAAVAAVALAFTQNAVAQETYPDPATPAGGALIVSIWDPSLGVSLVYAIPGVLYQDLVSGSFTSFSGAVPGFDTVFGASDPADINYQVAAAGLDENGRTAMYTTGPDSLPRVTSGNVAGTFINAQNFYFQLRSSCGTDQTCAAAAASDGVYVGQSTWGDLSIQLPYTASTIVSTTGSVGDALSFYSLAQADAPRVRPSDDARVASTGATWLLDANGNLTYVVPVPAAIWMLISGLLGFGAISRRRQAA